MRSILLLSVLTCAFAIHASSQRTCIVKEEIATVPGANGTVTSIPSPEVIIIPVVVHVLYNNADQNISNEQIRSQIKVLNQDYRKKNPDASYIPAAFKELAADVLLEFRLATIDPSGLATNGIIRKSTGVTAFALDDKIKSSVTGGDDPWNRDEYLNIWTGNLSGGMMGYASVPGCAPEKDGVVIMYKAFGTTANVIAPFNKGRTAVHEVGHWLGLRHIWGDADCGDDRIDDTPPQAGPTRGCPSGVVATCSSGAAGNMYMNFMDFTNDECTHMFTIGQAARMRELFVAGGARASLLFSGKAEGAVEVEDVAEEEVRNVRAYPNPAISSLSVNTASDEAGEEIIIYNNLGQVTKRFIANGGVTRLDVTSLKSGMYFVSVGGKDSFKFIKGQ